MWNYKGNLSIWILEQLQGLILPVYGLLRRNTSPRLLNTSIPFTVIFFVAYTNILFYKFPRPPPSPTSVGGISQAGDEAFSGRIDRWQQ